MERTTRLKKLIAGAERHKKEVDKTSAWKPGDIISVIPITLADLDLDLDDCGQDDVRVSQRPYSENMLSRLYLSQDELSSLKARFTEFDDALEALEDTAFLLMERCFPGNQVRLGPHIVQCTSLAEELDVDRAETGKQHFKNRELPIYTETLVADDINAVELFSLTEDGEFRLLDPTLMSRVKLWNETGIHDLENEGKLTLTPSDKLIDFYTGKIFLKFNPKPLPIPRDLILLERRIKKIKLPNGERAFPDYNPSRAEHLISRLSWAHSRIELFRDLIHVHLVDQHNEEALSGRRWELDSVTPYYPEVERIEGLDIVFNRFFDLFMEHGYAKNTIDDFDSDDIRRAIHAQRQVTWIERALSIAESLRSCLTTLYEDSAEEFSKWSG